MADNDVRKFNFDFFSEARVLLAFEGSFRFNLDYFPSSWFIYAVLLSVIGLIVYPQPINFYTA